VLRAKHIREAFAENVTPLRVVVPEAEPVLAELAS
jgi:hypothetical protein